MAVPHTTKSLLKQQKHLFVGGKPYISHVYCHSSEGNTGALAWIRSSLDQMDPE